MNASLFLGDCLEVMGSKRFIDSVGGGFQNCVIVTDPPFNVGYRYRSYKDRMGEDDYWAWLKNVLTFCPFSGVVVIHYPEAICRLSMELGKAPDRVVSWVYNSNTAKQHRDVAYFGIKPDFRKVTQPYKNPNDKRIKERIARGITGGRLYDWWLINQTKNVSKKDNPHPCVMPVDVMQNAIAVLPDGLAVVDPFMGSGTTGVACANLKRRFIGIEMDSEYFATAERRIRNSELRNELICV